MSELEEWLDLMHSFGLEPTKQDTGRRECKGRCIVYFLDQGDPKVGGHFNFYQDWVFSLEGKFIETGCWE